MVSNKSDFIPTRTPRFPGGIFNGARILCDFMTFPGVLDRTMTTTPFLMPKGRKEPGNAELGGVDVMS